MSENSENSYETLGREWEPTLQDLGFFHQIAQTILAGADSLTAAAVRCGTTYQTANKKLRPLEAFYNCQLISRPEGSARDGFSLTDDGKELFKAIDRIIEPYKFTIATRHVGPRETIKSAACEN